MPFGNAAWAWVNNMHCNQFWVPLIREWTTAQQETRSKSTLRTWVQSLKKIFASFFLWRIHYMACKNKATWFSYLEFKQDGGNYAPSRRGFVCTKTDHGLDQYSSSSITRIKFCRNYAIWKYISTTYLMCFGFRQKERCSGHISPMYKFEESWPVTTQR